MRFAGKSLSEPTLKRLRKWMGFSRKKKLWERWNEREAKCRLEGGASLIARCLLSYVRRRNGGWYRKGERLYCSVPHNRGKNTTLLASMSVEGIGLSLAVEGVTNSQVFETYVERVLEPSLHRRQVVVMDKEERTRELVKGRGCELL
jgi:hypothetical protein